MPESATPSQLATESLAVPVTALLLGALAMGISPIFVRFADVGPFASAFWRVSAALPLLWAWAAWETRRRGERLSATFRFDRAIVLTGLTFGGAGTSRS